jgi:hypothetical protein
MTDPIVKHGAIGQFSGPVIRGTLPAYAKPPTMQDTHLDRAFWLTTMVESGGMAGSIMAADGTGMTASMEQLVAVLPRHMDEQGALFEMLQELTKIIDITEFLPFAEHGWKLEGSVLKAADGKPVPPRVIRNTFTPNDGRVPASGPQWEQSKKWALAFHNLFAQPETIKFQIDYGIAQFVKFGNSKNPRLGNGVTKRSVNELAYNGKLIEHDPFNGVTVNDLAMAMWWCYKVNGPAPALDRLASAAKLHKDPTDPEFGRRLIVLLRTSQYGKWSSNRYDRTRQHARTVWPVKFFEGPDAAMPAR